MSKTLTQRLNARLGDDDHYLRHVTDDTTEFQSRHTRRVSTEVTDMGFIVHNIIESFDSDANPESLIWRRGIPRNNCPFCDSDLETDTETTDEQRIEHTTCTSCPFTIRRASVRAEYNSPEDNTPIFFRAIIPHNFDNDPDLNWEDARSGQEENDNPVSELANVVRSIYLRKYIGTIRDKAYDSDEKAIRTKECAVCGTTVEEPATRTHEHFGTVCRDCEDASAWTPEDADLPDDVRERMDKHKTFNPGKIRALLRDVAYWGAYRRKRQDKDDESTIPDGINTGEGGKIDAQAMGRGVKGTGLRRPDGGPFHNMAQWRTLLADAKDTNLIERADSGSMDDEHEDARWSITDKGRDVLDALARCETCGGDLKPFHYRRVYQSRGKYNNADDRLTMACPDCDDMQSKSTGMTISSSTGKFRLMELPGVNYD